MRWVPLAALALSAIALFEVTADGPLEPDQAVLASLLALGMTAPLALARLWPLVAALLSGLAAVATLTVGDQPPVAGALALVALYTIAGVRRKLWTLLLLLLPLAVYALISAQAPDGGNRTTAGFVLTAAALGGAAGAAWRLRAELRRSSAVERAAQDSYLEHIARGERARIARELHDVVAHHISMIAVQAEAARLTTPGLPPEGAKRLVAIGDTARTALTEMRRLLGVLREDADAAVEPNRRPQPGLGQLNDLLDEVRALGQGSTRLIVRGAVAPLDQGIELTAYRIVQEALTNARRHAAGAAVDVELHYRDDALVVRVRDSGPGPGVQGSGHGLAGMRERATMAGGSLETRMGPMGGFVVEAVLPKGTV
ncbi:sensor histidine kinase [Hamadaea tsunoensis]|uniref:sensor histidine kinase n=1 Tax=Hamadaea tsunoensis TaxID=53368 RepID=UPI001FDFBBD9|nr:sensor histidine kinase [Hamadaea tsunoensis]